MIRLYTVEEVAKHWGISSARVRAIIAHCNKTGNWTSIPCPDYMTAEPRYFWLNLVDRKPLHDD